MHENETRATKTGAAKPEPPDAETAETEMTLAPVTPRPVRPVTRHRRWAAALVVVGVAVAVGLLVNNLLGDAALYFYNVDEAVSSRDELGSRRFRLQGTPLGEIVETFDNDQPVLAFAVGFEGALINVVHSGDPPELFQPGVPVVLEGSWEQGSGPGTTAADGWYFSSDRMLVKHDNDYRDRDDYEQRITEADEGGAA